MLRDRTCGKRLLLSAMPSHFAALGCFYGSFIGLLDVARLAQIADQHVKIGELKWWVVCELAVRKLSNSLNTSILLPHLLLFRLRDCSFLLVGLRID